MYIGLQLEFKSMTLSDLEYEGATVGYCQLSGLLVSHVSATLDTTDK